jgi:threonine dehydratase
MRPSPDWILEAAQRIAPHAHRTPVLRCRSLDRRANASLFFKCENFQRTGSFKFRGACNAVAALSPDARCRGVVTHSSGNHAQALACAADIHEIPCYVVMPEDAPRAKVEATRAYGAQIAFCEPTHTARTAAAETIRTETGSVLIHPHDDPWVIAGQGTACMELFDEVGELDLVLVPVGGGGLLSGTLLAAQLRRPSHVTVIGCEPAGADDAARGLAAGQRVVNFAPKTLADGLRTPLGEMTFRIIQRLADNVLTVPDDRIVNAMRFVWERMKIVIEPSAAVAVAPLLDRTVDAAGERVGVILSGGNIDFDRAFRSVPST